MVSTQSNRTIYGKTLAELGARDARIVVLDADVPKSTNTYQFRDRFPERFFNVGVAEQNEMCIAAGLATAGKIPFVSTFATFASMRACDQIRQSIAYPHLNVKIVATNAGIENNGDGATHQAIEDMAILRAFPNMTVLCPSDPVTTRLAVIRAYEYDGPVYMRLGRYENPVLHAQSTRFEIGRAITLCDGNDVAIVACGRMVEEALKAVQELSAQGIMARVLDCHTIKPIDREAILKAARETKGIVTAEDHSIIGGLGGAVCEVLAEEHPAIVKRVGVRDTFAGSGRDWRALMSHYHVDAAQIVTKVKEIITNRM